MYYIMYVRYIYVCMYLSTCMIVCGIYVCSLYVCIDVNFTSTSVCMYVYGCIWMYIYEYYIFVSIVAEIEHSSFNFSNFNITKI